MNCLEPFFERRINQSLEKITQINNAIKTSLGAKKKANTFNCAHCNIKTKTLPDLKVHMKMCHTKPSIETPRNNKLIRIDMEPMKKGSLAIEHQNHVDQRASIQVPKISNILVCDLCDFETFLEPDLSTHIKDNQKQLNMNVSNEVFKDKIAMTREKDCGS